MSYHGPVESSWDGVMSGGMFYEGSNHIRCADHEERMSIDGSHTSKVVVVKPDDGVSGLT